MPIKSCVVNLGNWKFCICQPDHPPPHCHVFYKNEKTSRITLHDDPIVLTSNFTSKEQKKQVQIVKEYLEELRSKWSEVHGGE